MKNKKPINISNFDYEVFNFPCGEKHVKLCEFYGYTETNLTFNFSSNEDIVELLLVANAIKEANISIDSLFIPYVPFSRQDRINVKGECFSLKVFCELVNSIGAKEVVIDDPHSDVTPALLKNCTIIHQHEIFEEYFRNKDILDNTFYLVSPDGGALKKIYKLAKAIAPVPVIECTKQRDTSTGEILGINVNCNPDLRGADCYIVDDICDGGRTFIEIAKELKKRNPGKIILMVTHGFFTKGLEVFDGIIDEIYTRTGKVK